MKIEEASRSARICGGILSSPLCLCMKLFVGPLIQDFFGCHLRTAVNGHFRRELRVPPLLIAHLTSIYDCTNLIAEVPAYAFFGML